jgi:hypothetical protein
VLWGVGLGLAGLTVSTLSSPGGGEALAVVLCLTALLLLTLFLVLADLDLALRAVIFLAIGAPVAVVVPAITPGNGEVLGALAAILAIMVGVMLPVRLYVGSLGPPRPGDTGRRASLRSLFLLTTYYAVVAAFLRLSRDGAGLAVYGLVLSIVSLGPLLLLARPLGLRIAGGTVTACLALLAIYSIGVAVVHGFRFVSSELILMLSPAAACVLLGSYGVRLRR